MCDKRQSWKGGVRFLELRYSGTRRGGGALAIFLFRTMPSGAANHAPNDDNLLTTIRRGVKNGQRREKRATKLKAATIQIEKYRLRMALGVVALFTDTSTALGL